jgi:hypothetical protein
MSEPWAAHHRALRSLRVCLEPSNSASVPSSGMVNMRLGSALTELEFALRTEGLLSPRSPTKQLTLLSMLWGEQLIRASGILSGRH